jgi:hypothetical protein
MPDAEIVSLRIDPTRFNGAPKSISSCNDKSNVVLQVGPNHWEDKPSVQPSRWLACEHELDRRSVAIRFAVSALKNCNVMRKRTRICMRSWPVVYVPDDHFVWMRLTVRP